MRDRELKNQHQPDVGSEYAERVNVESREITSEVLERELKHTTKKTYIDYTLTIAHTLNGNPKPHTNLSRYAQWQNT